MALTRAQIQTAFQNSLGRAASANEENSYFSVSQSGALADGAVVNSISNSREADLNADPVVRFYQAAFGRVPDQAGLDNATDYVRSFGATAQTYQSLANMFVTSPEFTNRFGTSTQVDNAYVTALYNTILGRTPSSGEVDAFVSGSNGYTTRGQVLYAISQSQEAISISNDAVNGFLNNAATGTAVYTGSLYTAGNGSPTAPGNTGGLNLAFTTAPDTLNGGAGNDTFTGVTSSVAASNTFTAADRAAGGAGTDTLRLVSQDTAANVTILGSNFTGIETLTTTNLSDGAITYTATGVAGLANVVNEASSQAVVVGNLGAVGSVTASNTGAATTVVYADTAVASASDAVTVTANGVTGAAQINVNSATGDASGVETINVVSTGTTNSFTLNTNDTGLTRIAFSGGTAATVALGANAATAATLDGSAMTGNLTVTGIGAAVTTATGGAGNDTFNFGANFTIADTVNGGAGTDVLGANAAQLAAVTTRAATVTNIETVLLADNAGADATINLANFGATNFELGVAQTGGQDIIVNGLVSGSNVRFDAATDAAAADLQLNVTNATLPGSADVLNFDLRGGAVTYVATATGVETINVTASNATGASTLAITDTSLTTLNLTNTGNFAIDTGTLGAAVSSVNASGVTGTAGTTITLNGTATTGAQVLGSGNADIINGSQLVDVINSGAGNDTITAGAGADRINVGAGTDIVVQGVGASGTYTAPTVTNTISTTTFDIVTGLAAGDQIDLTNAARTITNANTLVNTAPLDNTAIAVRGTYDATAQTFVGSATGADTLFTYDADATATVANEAIVLVGYVNNGTATSLVADGIFTLA